MPPRTRAPFPIQGLVLICLRLLSWSEVAMAICAWVGFHAYLRPRELTGLRQQQLLKPGPLRVSRLKYWSLNLHPQEFLVASKTGYWDETVELDDAASRSWLPPFFEVLAGSGSSQPLWPFDHGAFVKRYREAAGSLHLETLETSLYALRHGGASWDWASQTRSLLAIKVRGRWQSDASLRRYQKAALLQGEINKIPLELRQAAEVALKELGSYFNNFAKARDLLHSAGV